MFNDVWSQQEYLASWMISDSFQWLQITTSDTVKYEIVVSLVTADANFKFPLGFVWVCIS